MAVTLWSTSGPEPARLERRGDFLEQQLETWIEANPAMVADGLTWVARQPRLAEGSIPDLIGLTREGALIVAELKRGQVNIGSLAQALRYVLVLSSMDAESVLARLNLTSDHRALLTAAYEDGGLPEIGVLLIGTSRVPELESATTFLSARGLDLTVRITTFTPFLDASGQVLLARETEDHDTGPERTPTTSTGSRTTSIEKVLQMARDAGVGGVMEDFIRTAEALGLRVKPWPRSMTIVPLFTRGRTLLYLGPAEDGRLHYGYNLENFIELYGAEEPAVEGLLGDNWVELPPAEVQARLSAFTELMTTLQQSSGL